MTPMFGLQIPRPTENERCDGVGQFAHWAVLESARIVDHRVLLAHQGHQNIGKGEFQLYFLSSFLIRDSTHIHFASHKVWSWVQKFFTKRIIVEIRLHFSYCITLYSLMVSWMLIRSTGRCRLSISRPRSRTSFCSSCWVGAWRYRELWTESSSTSYRNSANCSTSRWNCVSLPLLCSLVCSASALLCSALLLISSALLCSTSRALTSLRKPWFSKGRQSSMTAS